MGRIHITLPDDLEEQFRRAAFDRKGPRKGNLQEAIIEALERWMKEG